MNKYQLAFKFLLDDYYRTPKHWEDYLTIKEAIDNYSTMEEQVKTCEHSADKKIELLEKALDKACEILNDNFYCNTLWECENTDEKQKYRNCCECIKSHLLRGEK